MSAAFTSLTRINSTSKAQPTPRPGTTHTISQTSSRAHRYHRPYLYNNHILDLQSKPRRHGFPSVQFRRRAKEEYGTNHLSILQRMVRIPISLLQTQNTNNITVQTCCTQKKTPTPTASSSPAAHANTPKKPPPPASSATF